MPYPTSCRVATGRGSRRLEGTAFEVHHSWNLYDYRALKLVNHAVEAARNQWCKIFIFNVMNVIQNLSELVICLPSRRPRHSAR
jgi:hypothetical protein